MAHFALVRKADGRLLKCLEFDTAPVVAASESYRLVPLTIKEFLDVSVLEAIRKPIALDLITGRMGVMASNTLYAGYILKSNDMLSGTWSGPGPTIPVPDPNLNYYMEELSTINMRTVEQGGGLYHEGSGILKWLWDTNTSDIVEQPDPRPIVRFTPGAVQKLVDPAGSPENILLEVLDARGDLDTAFNGNIRLSIAAVFVQVAITNGTGNFDIDITEPMCTTINSSDDIYTENPLTIDIDATRVGR